MHTRQVRRATLNDARWIVDLSARVQNALTAAGSLQQIGPLPLEMVQNAAETGSAYLLEVAGQRAGSVLIELLPEDSPLYTEWLLQTLPGPLWFLRKLMLDPDTQGKGLGLDFLAGARNLLEPTGTLFLDCWAGSDKLRNFYLRAGFTFHGIFPCEDYEIAVFFYPLAVTSDH